MAKKTPEEKAEKKSLIDRLKKSSTIKASSVLIESKFFQDKDYVTTPYPAINIALSGNVDGGLSAGSFVLAAPSRHFKSMFALLFASSYFAKYPDAAMIFYDSEFGTPESYFDSFEIDKKRVLHTPLTNLEEFRFDIMKQLDDVQDGDRLIIIVDSLGNLASKKEVEDTLNQSGSEDMTRARKIKGLFRMVTPYLTIKDVPLITINHVYQTMEMFSKTVISGGSGVMLSADNAWIIGRQQDKDKVAGKDALMGYNFVINIEKSRHVKEKSKIVLNVRHDGGIAKWSGMFEIAKAGGFIHTPKEGYMQSFNPETGEIGDLTIKVKNNASNDAFWQDLVYSEPFKRYAHETFALGKIKMIGETMTDEEDDYDPLASVEDEGNLPEIVRDYDPDVDGFGL